MVTLLEGVLTVYSQGVSSNVRGKHPLGGLDKTLSITAEIPTNFAQR